MNDDEIINTAGDIEEELYFLASATQLRNKTGTTLIVTQDICGMADDGRDIAHRCVFFDYT